MSNGVINVIALVIGTHKLHDVMLIIILRNKLYDKMLWKMHSNTQHSIMHTCANKTTRYTDEDRN